MNNFLLDQLNCTLLQYKKTTCNPLQGLCNRLYASIFLEKLLLINYGHNLIDYS